MADWRVASNLVKSRLKRLHGLALQSGRPTLSTSHFPVLGSPRMVAEPRLLRLLLGDGKQLILVISPKRRNHGVVKRRNVPGPLLLHENTYADFVVGW